MQYGDYIAPGYGAAHRVLEQIDDYVVRVEMLMEYKVHNEKLAHKICEQFQFQIEHCAWMGTKMNKCRDEIFDMWLETKQGQKWKNTSQK